ncbi:aminoacyl-histidine dipeptidase [Bacteroidia bacterium]|nr:aminoacyl-histidine dipeptidase [Bacteroidia bacterium]
MNTNIENLEPKIVWNNFKKICNVPHPSHHEEKIREMMLDFCKNLGLHPIMDEAGNIIVSKPATKGMEDRKVIILQAHLDMVPQANSDKKHDFETDKISAYIDGEWVRADGTTLGADNGIGAAAAMAVLESTDLQHGTIECLFTATEETGMDGAFGLQPNMLKGDILLNLDSEDEGELFVGCAGGIDVFAEFDYTTEKVKGKALKLHLYGLSGGHSGLQIHLGRANANKVMARLLQKGLDLGLQIATFKGGDMRNAIPREAFVTIVLPEDKIAEFKKLADNFTDIFKKEFSATEPDLALAVEDTTVEEVMTFTDSKKLIDLIRALPNGVMRMSDAVPGLTETSTNMGIVRVKDGHAKIYNLARSSVESAKEALSEMFRAICDLSGVTYETEGGYPGWKPNMQSPILNTMLKVYEDNFGKKPKVMAVHAGLECGLFSTKYPHWDMISFGPTIVSPHSPDEKVKIDTVGKFWDFLVKTLENAPKK